ncbi:MAG: phosphate ABC transporter permease subunit PstC [Acidimicrobiia bacterium]
MTAKLAAPPGSHPGAGPGDLMRRGARLQAANSAFGLVVRAAAASVFVVLALIVVTTTKEAWPAFREVGPGFVSGTQWSPSTGTYGALPFIYGTMVSSLIALVLALPVSIGIALFVNEFAPRRLRAPGVYLIDLLAAIPSVVYGLWGVLALGPFLLPFVQKVAATVGTWPVFSSVFGGPVGLKSMFLAALILTIMIVPIITSLTREVFDTVPVDQKAAAFALGATRWEMVRGAIFPHSRNGMIAAVLIGFGRAMGETIAVALVIGSTAQITTRIFAPADSMAGVIANTFAESSGVNRAALVGLGVVLFVMTILVNFAGQLVARRAERRGRAR